MLTILRKNVLLLLAAILILTGFVTAAHAGGQRPPIAEGGEIYHSRPEANPLDWNPHTWTTLADMIMLEYVISPFAGNFINEDGVRVFEFEAANNITDITAEFPYLEKWGIDPAATEGFVWKIELNPDVRWCDGTEITADCYIWSMRQLLAPGTSLSRAGRYSIGAEAIRNAAWYRNNLREGQPRFSYAVDFATAENVPEDVTLVINPDMPSFFFNGASMYDFFQGPFGPVFFTDCEYGNLIYKFRGTDGYIPFTEDLIPVLLGLAAAFRDDNPDAWLEFLHVIDGVHEYMPWEDVGLIKADEHTLLYITSYPMTEEAFLILMRRNWLVRDGAYQMEGYNSSENTKSFGPYRLVSITETEILLERNPYWYGWDGTQRDGLFSNERFGDYETVIVHLHLPEEEPAIIISGEEPAGFYPFPFPFEAVDVFGNTVTHEDLGKKEVWFVYFWATWCPSCVAALPLLDEITLQYEDSVGFIGLLLDFDQNQAGARRLVDYHGFAITHVSALNDDLAELNEMVRSGFVPTTIIIDGEGNNLSGHIIGLRSGYVRDIEEALSEVRGR